MRRLILFAVLALILSFCECRAAEVLLQPVYVSALDIPIDSLTPEQRQMWMEQAEKIYYAPESPTRDEEMYIVVLQKILASTKLTDIEKERYRFQLKECMKNRVGEKFADFQCIGIDGNKRLLYKDILNGLGIPPLRGLGGVIYFFNPDCHDCVRVSEILNNDSTIQSRLADSTLYILPVYPDEDLTGWEKVPADGRVIKNGLPAVRLASPAEREKFHLPAIPSLYLLDAGGTVLLKDVPVERLIKYLAQ